MAIINPALLFENFSGKLSRDERLVMRTRNGRTHSYAIKHPYSGPLAESRKRAINTFAQAVRLCKSEMSDPDRLAWWQDRYSQYTKAARSNIPRANARFLGALSASQTNASNQPQKPSTKFYSTLRGFIIASLSAQLKSAE